MKIKELVKEGNVYLLSLLNENEEELKVKALVENHVITLPQFMWKGTDKTTRPVFLTEEHMILIGEELIKETELRIKHIIKPFKIVCNVDRKERGKWTHQL
jgi:hypothetical protein